MTTLYVPLSLPVHMAQSVLARELRHREVLFVKRNSFSLVIEHEPTKNVVECLSCEPEPFIVL